MKINFSGQTKYITLNGIISTLATLCVWFDFNVFFSSAIFLAFLFFSSLGLSKFVIDNKKILWRLFFGFLFLLATSISFLSIIYQFYEINQTTVSLNMIFLFVLSIYHKEKFETRRLFEKIKNIDFKKINKIKTIYFFVALFILYKLFSKNYGDTLASPWTIINKNFFLAFGLATTLLLYFLQTAKKNRKNLFFVAIHYFIILGIALIIFKNGYGFDPVIHETAEKHIRDFGFILPKTPYYIGQYSLVLFAHFISKIPIEILDKSLVPVGASVFLPLTFYFVFSKLKFQKILPALAVLPFLPLTFFIQTTPNNLALLFSFAIFSLLWLQFEKPNKKMKFLCLILCLATILIHPFIGIPTTLICVFSFVASKKENKLNKIIYPIYFLALAVSLPLIFILKEKSLSIISNPFENLSRFFSIFTPPHWFIYENESWKWKLLYFYRNLIKPFAIIFSYIGFLLYRKNPKQTAFFVSTVAGLLVSAFLLATAIDFKDVISYEQTVYSGRILELILIFLFPFLFVFFADLFKHFENKKIKQIISSFILAIFLTISLYFLYPTVDPISRYTGFSVRDIDLKAIEFIENQSKDEDYIVLTNQTISAGAIIKYGFKKYYKVDEEAVFYYSIPTGGPLYQYFRKMVYEEPKKQWMEEAMLFAGVKKAYFVHTNYWAPAGKIRDDAKKEADEWWNFEDKLWVYEYNLK